MTRSLLRVEYRDRAVVYAVPVGTTTRGAAERTGAPRYVRRGARWQQWTGEPCAPGRCLQLDATPVAEPDPERVAVPGRFEVPAWLWCNWPQAAREALRAAADWTKRPGTMATDALDGDTAERVRALAAQHQLAGLEESP